jgi:hypothetical protein
MGGQGSLDPRRMRQMISQYGPGSQQPQVMPGAGGQQTGIPGAPTPPSYGGSLYDAGMQGLGMGLAPFNTNFYNALGSAMNENAQNQWNQNIKPTLDYQSIQAGGYGGDRAALAQGAAFGNLNANINNALIPQVTQGYENYLNRGVQAGNAALGHDLGYGGLNLGQYQADTQRQLGVGNLNLDAYDSQLRGMLGLGGLDINAYNAQTNAAQGAAGAAGTPQYTNPWLAGIGGLSTLGSIFGLFNQQPAPRT